MQKFQLGKEVSGKSGQKIAIISKWVILFPKDPKAAEHTGSLEYTLKQAKADSTKNALLLNNTQFSN